MKITALLCNHAEAQNNLLYISGAGIDRSWVPPGTPAPYVVTLALAVIVDVPWQATNQQHKILVNMVDADDHMVMLPADPGGAEAPVQVEFEFNVGRPPNLAVGEDQHVSIAVNLPGIPLPQLGRYRFFVEVDGSREAEIPYQLVHANTTMGFGPGVSRI